MLLADQDRSLWDTAQIAEGRAVLDRALALRGRGPYVVQAAIASLHADEPRDWPQIAALYGELARLTDSPVVELNRAVAVAEAHGPRGGARASSIGLDLDDYRYLHSTRGELLRRLGRTDEARDAYRRALALVHDDAERRLARAASGRALAPLGSLLMPETPTLFVCHGDDGGPRIHPCRRVQEALRAAGIEYDKVIAAHGNPIPFLRKGSRDELRDATGATKLPALKLADGTVITHSRAILSWIGRAEVMRQRR